MRLQCDTHDHDHDDDHHHDDHHHDDNHNHEHHHHVQDEIALRPADFPPCCNQLLDCPGIERDEFAYFYCVDARYVKGGQQFRQTCEEQLYFVERRRANEG